jgi:carbonic anhydrase
VSNDERTTNLSADEALSRLRVGNARYVEGRSDLPMSQSDRRPGLMKGQRPFATILACADSRVDPCVVFDQGLGDLFVIRVAGNISTPVVLGSIEYASLHLGVNLILVAGHQSCGAVTAAVAQQDFDGPEHESHIDHILASIQPAVLLTADRPESDRVEAAIRENARLNATAIAASDPVMRLLAGQGVRVVPAYYSLKTGAVDWLKGSA